MSGTLDGRVALVTGTSQGIGRACAEALLEAGATVVGCSRTMPSTSYGTRYQHRIINVEEPTEIEALVVWTGERFGRLDILVNNAGTHPPSRSIEEFSVDDFDWIVRLNLRSVFLTSRAAMPMLRTAKGSIVNIGSAVGLYGQEGAVTYCATKAGISGLSKALAIDEAPHGVRVNTVCPGAILTPLALNTHDAERRTTIESWSWMNRWGTSKEVADVVTFLAGDGARFVTGQDIVVGGGAELGYGLKGRDYHARMDS